MFKEEFDSVEHKDAISGSLLNEARLLLKEKPIAAMTDLIGTYAYLYSRFALVAKQYIYGDVVSCHHNIAEICYARGHDIVMFLGKTKTFYKFKPSDILREGKVNYKGDAKMINFSIRLGMRWEESADEQQPAKLDRWFTKDKIKE